MAKVNVSMGLCKTHLATKRVAGWGWSYTQVNLKTVIPKSNSIGVTSMHFLISTDTVQSGAHNIHIHLHLF